MDATKIGTFIAAERRAKGLDAAPAGRQTSTDGQSSQPLGDRKGPAGCFVLLPLAAALDVSVGELLAGRASPSRLRYRPPGHEQRNSLPATRGSLARSCAAAVPAQCWPGCCCLPQRFYLCNFCGCWMGGAGIHGLSVTSLLLLVVLPFVLRHSPFGCCAALHGWAGGNAGFSPCICYGRGWAVAVRFVLCHAFPDVQRSRCWISGATRRGRQM